MAIIGFLFVVCMAAYVTVATFGGLLTILDSRGKDKFDYVLTIFLALLAAAIWCCIYQSAPFSITFS